MYDVRSKSKCKMEHITYQIDMFIFEAVCIEKHTCLSLFKLLVKQEKIYPASGHYFLTVLDINKDALEDFNRAVN